jgi:hypothetical protein
MGRKELSQQRELVKSTIAAADEAHLRYALDGTIGDAQAFCWAALRQFERKYSPKVLQTSKDFGLHHADLHLLLIVAHEAVSHAEQVERLLSALSEPQKLPPDPVLRDRLREARNLLAEHRDERALYWRLTALKTPHVIETYSRLGIPLPDGSIDSETLGYFAPPGATEAEIAEIAEGQASVGTVGGMLSLPELHASLLELESELEVLAQSHQGKGAPPPGFR